MNKSASAFCKCGRCLRYRYLATIAEFEDMCMWGIVSCGAGALARHSRSIVKRMLDSVSVTREHNRQICYSIWTSVSTSRARAPAPHSPGRVGRRRHKIKGQSEIRLAFSFLNVERYPDTRSRAMANFDWSQCSVPSNSSSWRTLRIGSLLMLGLCSPPFAENAKDGAPGAFRNERGLFRFCRQQCLSLWRSILTHC